MALSSEHQDDSFSFDEIVKANRQLDLEDEQTNSMAFRSIAELESHNQNLVETTVRFLGDRTIIAEIV